jgi:hypothetical protein
MSNDRIDMSNDRIDMSNDRIDMSNDRIDMQTERVRHVYQTSRHWTWHDPNLILDSCDYKQMYIHEEVLGVYTEKCFKYSFSFS